MLKEIILSTGIMFGGAALGQTNSQENFIIELLSKNYTLQDTTMMNGEMFLEQKYIYESYEQLKENHKNPELIDSFIEHLKSIGTDKFNEEGGKKLLEELLKEQNNNPENNFLIGGLYEWIDKQKAKEHFLKAYESGLKNSELSRKIADCKLSAVSGDFIIINSLLKRKDLKEGHLKVLKVKKQIFEKELQEIISLYKESISLDSENKPSYWHLAEVYELKGMHKEALETTQKTFEITAPTYLDFFHRILILDGMFEKTLEPEVLEATKKRYLKDINIVYKSPVDIYMAYQTITSSGVFTQKEITKFRNEYLELIKDSPFFEDTIQNQ